MNVARTKPHLMVKLAGPRGFCAGVDRAIQIVEQAIQKFGAPVYVRHEIVHNRYVVESLEAKGAVFVEELDECPDDRPVVFSAHGVPKSVPAEAEARQMIYVDATCPLVSKVHREAERHHADGRLIVFIGHAGHPEAIGTMGQLPPGAILLVETKEDVAKLDIPADAPLAYVTQTTLSVDDTQEIIDTLRVRFPQVAAPKKEDICYATTNRQASMRAVAKDADAVIVIGAPNSSNSRRLVEVASAAGAQKAMLLQKAADLDWDFLDDVRTLGISAGASAPEILVTDLLDKLRERFEVEAEEITLTEENVIFKLPKIVTA
ncbi:MAG: 4-hydroxy-3-methylbut-2-enyl diphosphate reductase [Alphaproteobacteria bacterium]|nr:4-hydroxy-3-methylbut-2-enyl diphosphate reductase [Alphaproteobacteria bacterium]